MIVDNSTSDFMKDRFNQSNLEGVIAKHGTTGAFDWFLNETKAGHVKWWKVGVGTHTWIDFEYSQGTTGRIGFNR